MKNPDTFVELQVGDVSSLDPALANDVYSAEPISIVYESLITYSGAVTVDSRGDVYVGEVSYTIRGRQLTPRRELRSLQKFVRAR